VVTTLVRLRFLLLYNTLRKSVWQLIAAILGAAYGLGALGFAVAGLVALSFAPLELARTVTTLAGALLTLGWVLLPVFTAGIDQTVEPQRLATFPIPRDQLLLALAVSGVLGVPGIVTSIAALSTAFTWWKFPLAAVTAVVCAAIGVLTCVVGSRMLVALASRISTGRRAREATRVLLLIPLILLGPILIGAGELVRSLQNTLPAIADAVSWTPIGAAWAVAGDVAAGEFGTAGLKLLIALATLGVALLVWRWALARALEIPVAASATTARIRGRGFFDRFPATPWGAVAARALTYWLRDPRYAQSLIAVPLIPALIFFYVGTSDNTALLNAVGPIVAVLLAMSIYTDVSYDNTAFALHLQKGVTGRDDRLGRVVALAVFAVPVSLLLTVAAVALTNSWLQLPGLIGITIGVLLTGFAVSSVFSAAFIVPVPVPGESPFKAKPGGGFSLVLSTFVSWGLMGVLVLPELLLAIVGFATGDGVWGWLALAVALVLGSTLLALGVHFGGRILDARGPELLAKLQVQR